MTAQRELTLSDSELLLLLEQGRSPAQIARRQRVPLPAVSARLQRLRERLPAPGGRRAEAAVTLPLDVIAELHANIAALQALKEACLRQLAAPGALDVGPHADDRAVMVSEDDRPPVRRPRQERLSAADPRGLAVTGKVADPRPLLVSVLAQIRLHLELSVKLAERAHDVQEVARFQTAVITAIEQADPATAARIKEALLERRSLRRALAAPGESERLPGPRRIGP